MQKIHHSLTIFQGQSLDLLLLRGRLRTRRWTLLSPDSAKVDSQRQRAKGITIELLGVFALSPPRLPKMAVCQWPRALYMEIERGLPPMIHTTLHPPGDSV